MSTKSWSKFQTNIFDFVEHGEGNAIIDAVAGSGKSTTIVEALNRVKGSSIFLAFNKSIADELKSRGVNARTFHSLTFSPVVRAKGARGVEMNKLSLLCKTYFTGEELRIYGSFAQKMVSLARQAGFGCLVQESKHAWMDIIDYHNLELDTERGSIDRAIELSSELLKYSNMSKMVDFDDLLYLAVKDGISLPKFDMVFVDEAQDTNAIQRAILRKILKPESRLVAVGDPAQAIYGFRGADSDSMDLIKQEFGCIELPLSISYRCPTSVVEYAQRWVRHIEAAPKAPAGEVNNLGKNWDNGVFQCGDLVVCRRTAPLISLAYSLLRARIGVQVMGRDIGEGLKALVRKMQAQNIDHLVDKLGVYQTRETEKAIAKGLEAKAEAIKDKVVSIKTLIECLGEDNRTVSALIGIVDELFADKKSCVTLATIHKAKGLEADRVFWLDYNWSAKWNMKPWQSQQEMNLCYVAVTRAKKALFTLELKN